MSISPTSGGATPSGMAQAREFGPPTQRLSVPWHPTLPSAAAEASITFSSVSNRLSDGLQVGEDRTPPPGQLAVVMAALMIGLLLMGTQLWLLTVALELYLGGKGRQVWLLALVSGAIFAGGVVMLRLLGRRPRLGR